MGFLNHDEMASWLSEVPRDELAAFGRSLSQQWGRDARVRDTFWAHPLGLARMTVRELLRARLVRAHRIPALDNSS